jgi:glycosyltransferase involved in cell wall biosynthesis
MKPLVSVVLATHERPRFLPLALACYRHQTYPNRELIVVDDGAEFPVAAVEVAGCGGRLLRFEPGTPLGAKMNLGLRQAAGPLCLKMDDDDWYAPEFLETLVQSRLEYEAEHGAPGVTCLAPFLFFDLGRWEVRVSHETQFGGATLLFDRRAWEMRPFRPVPRRVDTWFLRDQSGAELHVQPVTALETFLQVRHGKHLWTSPGGRPNGKPAPAGASTLRAHT